MRTLDSTTLAALESDNFEYAYLCDLPSGLFFTSHGTDLTVGGQVYTSNGLVTGFAPVSQTQAVSLATYNLTLSNVDITVAQTYAATNHRGHSAIIYMAIVQNGAVVGTPSVIYKGTLDSFGVKESGTGSTLSLKITSHWANYNQKGGRYTSDSVQQGIHAGDRLFKYAHEESSDSLGWGKR